MMHNYEKWQKMGRSTGLRLPCILFSYAFCSHVQIVHLCKFCSHNLVTHRWHLLLYTPQWFCCQLSLNCYSWVCKNQLIKQTIDTIRISIPVVKLPGQRYHSVTRWPSGFAFAGRLLFTIPASFSSWWWRFNLHFLVFFFRS